MLSPRRWTTAGATAVLLAVSGLAAFAVEGGHLTLAATSDADLPLPGPTGTPTDGPTGTATEDADGALPDPGPSETEAPGDDVDLPDPAPTEAATLDPSLPAPAPTMSEAPRNHGQVVSEFAHTTELTGCARGHAVSAVARGLDPSEAKPCRNDDAEDEATETATPEELATGDGDTTADATLQSAGEDPAASDGGSRPGNGHGKANGQGRGHANGHAKHGGRD